MKKIQFIHISKNGGTNIQRTLAKYSTVDLKGQKCKLILNKHDFELPNLLENDFCFFVIRDVYSRFVSAFYHRRRQERPRFQYFTEMDKKIFEVFKNPNQLAHSLDAKNKNHKFGLEAFAHIGHINSGHKKWLKNLECLEKHKSQIFWIGEQKTLNSDFKKLTSLLGIKNLNLSSNLNIMNTRKEPDKVELDEKSKSLLEEYYHEDLKLIQWCKNHKNNIL